MNNPTLLSLICGKFPVTCYLPEISITYFYMFVDDQLTWTQFAWYIHLFIQRMYRLTSLNRKSSGPVYYLSPPWAKVHNLLFQYTHSNLYSEMKHFYLTRIFVSTSFLHCLWQVSLFSWTIYRHGDLLHNCLIAWRYHLPHYIIIYLHKCIIPFLHHCIIV